MKQVGLLKNIFSKRNKRFLVIGLDGIPYTMVQKLCEKGVMPNIAKAAKKGDDFFKQMDVSIPEISSVSWVSFMTGTNSARHGIYGFTDLKPDSYDIYFPNFSTIKVATIWDKLAKEGKKSVVLNLPGTYPARELNGFLVSGFVAIDLKKAVYPPTIYEKLKAMDYRIDVDTTKAMEKEFFYKDLFDTLENRRRVFADFWKEESDLFIAVITETDRLQHFEWDAIEDEGHPRHEQVMRFYFKVDEIVGELLGRLNEEDDFLIMSDHGFCGITEEVYLNRILKENGFLDWENDPPENLGRLSSSAKAFALDPSRIYIHREGKYPKGKIGENEAEKLKDELKGFFLNVERNGKKIIRNVFFKEEIYEGPMLDKAPDLVLLSNWGYDLKGNIKSRVPFNKTHFTGMHTRDDAFLITKNAAGTKRPHIEDVFGIIDSSFSGKA